MKSHQKKKNQKKKKEERRKKKRTAESDDTRQCFAMLGNSGLFGIGRRFPHENAVMAFFNLVQCPGIIVSRYDFCFILACYAHPIQCIGLDWMRWGE